MQVTFIARDKTGHIDVCNANRLYQLEYLKFGLLVSQAGPLF